MKKGLIGCLLVGLLLVVVGAGLAWWYFVRPAWRAVSSGTESVQQWAKAADLEKSVTNKSAYTAPADGLLTAAQVQTFMAVQESVEQAMGQDAAALKKKYDAIDAQKKADGKDVDFSTAMGAVSDLGGLVAKAREAQVAALNQHNLSLEEYRWIRAQAMAAIPFIESSPGAEPASASTSGAPVVIATDKGAAVFAAPTDAASQKANDEAMAQLPPEARQAMAEAKAAGEKAKAEMAEFNNQPDVKAARANAVLLRPYKERLEKLMGSAWLSM